MQSFLLRFKVNQRLTAAFTLLILITLAIAASGGWALSRTKTQLDEIVQQNMAKIRHSAAMLDANARVVTAIQSMILETDPQNRPAYMDTIKQFRTQYDAERDALFALPASARGKALQDSLRAVRENARTLNQQSVDAGLAGDTEVARRSFEAGEAATQTWQDVIRENILLQQTEADAAYARAEAQALTGTRLLLGGTLLALALSAVLAFVITRSLVLPLRTATDAANRIARGDVGTTVQVQGRDETANLLHSMAGMQARLSSLIAAQRELSRQQMDGINSFRIDGAAFPGAFGELVQASNDLAGHNQALIARIVDTAASYSIGDLQVRMPALPGEQAAITTAMETTRANLLAISSSVQQLAAAAAEGDFSERGDATRFQHAFHTIIVDLNRLFDTCDTSLSDIARLLQAIADGDLTVTARGSHGGVFAHIRDAANRSADNLRQIIQGIQDSTAVISTSASEIATGNSDLSRRTEQQAANLEETAASMEELTSTVRQNAEHARQASDLAGTAEHSANEGRQAVADVVATMERIEASSDRVVEIVSVIDGIAFQTNILALNAAVEAARAGDQGRGFAVVASEVRTLAQRSASAAKDVKALIDGSSNEVKQGARLVRGAGTAMQDIAGAIAQVRQAVTEISAASQEQSAGIEQVNQAIVHMDEVTQQNAALVEEASAASRSLEDQAQLLNQAVSVFKVA